jgi:endonuclease/exonuclease/phosphatase family metal-dependent hydrolase
MLLFALVLAAACADDGPPPGAAHTGDGGDSPGGAPAGAPVSADTAPAFTLGTFNIHYVAPWQEGLRWEDRRDAVVAMLEAADADLMAFQEMETFEGGSYNEENRQLDWIARHFPEYAFAAVGDPQVYPSTQPVMYRPERFEPLDQGFFFFSPDPDDIYSRSWDGGFPAFASWVRFADRRSGTSFYLYNVHFDHSSRGNRIKAAELVVERLGGREHPGDPVIVAGDFNAPWFFRPVQIVSDAGLDIADTTGSTFHLRRGINIIPAIDHVLVSDGFEIGPTEVLRKRFAGTWPSDHYPVLVRLSPR